MSIYTTGEIAKLCGVTVRTVQYYDSRNILVPIALSEGGRRLYSEEELKRLWIICFLREAGLSINSISELLQEENPGSTVTLLLEQQILEAREALNQQQSRLNMLEALRRGISETGQFSPESIGDIASQMKSEKACQSSQSSHCRGNTHGHHPDCHCRAVVENRNMVALCTGNGRGHRPGAVGDPVLFWSGVLHLS